MSDEANDSSDELTALEKFVVENDDLLELEERIGRFNIFDALGVARIEIRHSNFLAWLLDPGESHGQGSLFLKAILMDLLKEASVSKRPLSPVELDGVELQGVDIFRERNNIDLLIRCSSPSFIIAIENKVDSGEHHSQLDRYEKAINREFAEIPRARRMFVFLTKDGADASDDDWVPYSYQDIYRVLSRCVRINASAVGGDVRVFIEHYLRLIGSRFMDDEKIDELCRNIYRNHRQALELVFERAGNPASGLVSDLEGLLREQDTKWIVFNRTSKVVGFVPRAWEKLLPPIGTRGKKFERRWLVAELHVGRTKCRLSVVAWRTSDPELRRKVIGRLTQSPKEFGLRVFSKKIVTDRWTRLCWDLVAGWSEDEDPDHELVLKAAKEKLLEFEQRIEKIPAALSEILSSSD